MLQFFLDFFIFKLYDIFCCIENFSFYVVKYIFPLPFYKKKSFYFIGCTMRLALS